MPPDTSDGPALERDVKKLRVLDMLVVLAKRRTLIITVVMTVSVAAAIYSLLATPVYTSTVVLMPPESSQSSLIPQLPAGLPFSGFLNSQLMGGSDETGIFIAVFYSRLLREDLIRKFKLDSLYGFTKAKRYFIEDVLRAVGENIGISLTDEGTLAISVDDESPERATAMAEFIVHKIDQIYSERLRQSAKNQRLFLEKRLAEVEVDLAGAEDSLVSFQVENKAVEVDAQTKAGIEAAARAEALRLSTQLEYDIARKLYGENHSVLKELRIRLREMNKQVKNLTDTRVSNLLIPLTESPTLGLELMRLLREVKIQETIFQLLTERYERAKIEEAKTIPHVQVLDPPVVPQKRSYPQRRVMVMYAFAFAFGASILLVFLLEALKALRSHATAEYRKLIFVIQSIPGVGLVWRWFAQRRAKHRHMPN